MIKLINAVHRGQIRFDFDASSVVLDATLISWLICVRITVECAF